MQSCPRRRSLALLPASSLTRAAATVENIPSRRHDGVKRAHLSHTRSPAARTGSRKAGSLLHGVGPFVKLCHLPAHVLGSESRDFLRLAFVIILAGVCLVAGFFVSRMTGRLFHFASGDSWPSPSRLELYDMRLPVEIFDNKRLGETVVPTSEQRRIGWEIEYYVWIDRICVGVMIKNQDSSCFKYFIVDADEAEPVFGRAVFSDERLLKFVSHERGAKLLGAMLSKWGNLESSCNDPL